MPTFLEPLLQYNDLGLFLLRLAIGAIFLYHGAPKLKNPGAMAKGMGWSPALPFLLGLVEVVSSVGMILGVYTQLAAILLGIVMLGALYFKLFRWKAPFSATDKLGWEYDLILLAASVAILLTGGGAIGVL